MYTAAKFTMDVESSLGLTETIEEEKVEAEIVEARPALIGVTVAEYLRDNNLDINLQPVICNAVKYILSGKKKINDFGSDLEQPLMDILNLITRPNASEANSYTGLMLKK